ncbi:Homeobox protein HD-11 [Dictyocoela muelleri]|nr:Homeobox protein HD-11 [Dictyocoela muelleri]
MEDEAIMGLKKLKNLKNRYKERDIKKNRQKNKYQKLVLNEIYNQYKYLTDENISDISILIDKAENEIKNWFQNKRSRDKILRKFKNYFYDLDSSDLKHFYGKSLELSQIIEISLYVEQNFEILSENK